MPAAWLFSLSKLIYSGWVFFFKCLQNTLCGFMNHRLCHHLNSNLILLISQNILFYEIHDLCSQNNKRIKGIEDMKTDM